MSQNNNVSPGGEKMAMSGISPVDSSIMPSSDPSVTVIETPVYIEGCPIKHKEVQKKADKIRQKYRLQIVFSVVRNLLCWCFLITLLILLAESTKLKDWHVEKLAALCVFFAFGMVGLGFHIARCYYDLTFTNPTVIALMLRDAMTVEDFQHRLQTYELSAPEVLIEVSLRSGAMSYGEANHWTRGSRKTGKELVHRGWSDQSSGIRHVTFPADATSMIFVVKDFRLVDDSSRVSLEREVADFRRDSGYDNNPYFMHMEYILNWKDADACPDAQAHLLFDGCRPFFYTYEFYRVCWFLGIDSLYRIAFHLNTKHVEEYRLIKFIERWTRTHDSCIKSLSSPSQQQRPSHLSVRHWSHTVVSEQSLIDIESNVTAILPIMVSPSGQIPRQQLCMYVTHVLILSILFETESFEIHVRISVRSHCAVFYVFRTEILPMDSNIDFVTLVALARL